MSDHYVRHFGEPTSPRPAPAPQPLPTLDLERLALAIHRSGIANCANECPFDRDQRYSGGDADLAIVLAREYEALSMTPNLPPR